jgi:hypothetical protein
MLFNQVSQRQPTTHDMADRERSKRVSIALLIRKSSVRARRGPPRICAGQKLRICFRPYRTVPKNGPKWHTLAHRVFESRTLDMVRSFTQSEQAADPVALAEPGCIAAGQRLAGPLIES